LSKDIVKVIHGNERGWMVYCEDIGVLVKIVMIERYPIK